MSFAHFETHHSDNGEVVMCLQSDGQCSVLVEIDANEEEQEMFIANTQKSLDLLDKFFDGKFADIFTGLHIKIGDGLVEGGAQALPSGRPLESGQSIERSRVEARGDDGASVGLADSVAAVQTRLC